MYLVTNKKKEYAAMAENGEGSEMFFWTKDKKRAMTFTNPFMAEAHVTNNLKEGKVIEV